MCVIFESEREERVRRKEKGKKILRFVTVMKHRDAREGVDSNIKTLANIECK